MISKGKCDEHELCHLAESLLNILGGNAILLLVVGGKNQGCSVKMTREAWSTLPKTLRDVADQLENDIKTLSTAQNEKAQKP